MAYIPEFQISVDADRECGFIYISDVSSYPLFTKARTALGIAMFWSIDDFTSVFGHDDSNGEEWHIEASNNQVFQIKGYLTDIWESGGTYNAGTQWKIVWHDGYFYIQDLAAVSGTPGSVGTTGWSRIAIGDTDPDVGGTITALKLYNLFEKSLTTEAQNYGSTLAYIETNCPLYYIERSGACHQWRVLDNSGGTITVSEVRLLTYDNILLDDELAFSANQIDIDLTAYEDGNDGAFFVEVYGQASGDTENTLKAKLLIYDFCDAEACFLELFRFIICKCNDPCGDDDCEEQFDIVEKRYDMNMIFGLYKSIERYVFVDKFQYMGSLSVSTTREELVGQVGRMIRKLKIITERCGKCGDDSNNDITC